ncbi:MAG: hypothetical protein WDN72_09560 [Alphaproteobacteria bacterium]
MVKDCVLTFFSSIPAFFTSAISVASLASSAERAEPSVLSCALRLTVTCASSGTTLRSARPETVMLRTGFISCAKAGAAAISEKPSRATGMKRMGFS